VTWDVYLVIIYIKMTDKKLKVFKTVKEKANDNNKHQAWEHIFRGIRVWWRASSVDQG
jgi:hypothetical protein